VNGPDILHYPAKGAGDIQDLGLAVGETSHDGTSGEDVLLMVRRFRHPVNVRQESACCWKYALQQMDPARVDLQRVNLQVWIRPIIGISLRYFQQKN
jgi:hypothetical protein